MIFFEDKNGLKTFIIITVICSSVFIIALFPVSNFDLFWHLAFGKVQFLQKQILTEEVFSHTKNGVAWYNHTWLSGLVFYGIYSVGGYKGLVLFKAFIVSLLALIMSFLLKVRGDKFSIIFSVILLMALSSLFRYLERPHIFTYLFIAFTYFILYRFLYCNGSKGQLFLLPFVAIIWVNLHSGVIFGFVIISVFIFGELVSAIFRERKISAIWINNKIRYLYIVLFLFTIASFLNPYGPAPYRVFMPRGDSGGLEIEGSAVNYMASMGVEFLSPSLDSFPLFWSTVIMILILSIVFYKKINLTELFVMSVFLLMAFKYNRAIGMFNIVMVPYVASLLKGFTEEKKYGKPIVHIFLVFLVGLTFYFKFFDEEGFTRMGFALNRDYVPVESTRFIKDKNIQGKMFNTEAIGGYLEWVFYPERKIFHDNRTNIFAGLYEEMHKPGMMEKYDIDYGIVMRSQFPPQILFPKAKWAFIFWDQCCSVYVRRNSVNASLIEEYEISYFKPDVDLNKMVAYAKKDKKIFQLIREMEHHLAYQDNLDYFLALARLYEETGKNERDKVKFLLGGLKKWPEKPRVFLALANSYYRMGQKEEAKKYFKEAVSLDGGDEFTLVTLGYIAYDERDFKNAESYFMRAMSHNRGFDQPYYGLGITYEKMGNEKKAVQYLQEYVKRSSDSKWKTVAESKLRNLMRNEKKQK